MGAIRADYFGSAAFGTITGISSMVLMIGMMGGPLVAGVLADHTGSYVPGFAVLAALSALGSVCFLRARRPRLAPSDPRTARRLRTKASCESHERAGAHASGDHVV